MFCKLFVLAALLAFAAAEPKPGYLAASIAAPYAAPIVAPIAAPITTAYAAPALTYGGYGYGAGLGYAGLRTYGGPGYGYGYGRSFIY